MVAPLVYYKFLCIVSMDTRRFEQWERLYQQKRHNLMEERCYHASQITDIDEVQSSFREMTARYGQRQLPKVEQAFHSSLQNLRSFTSAISSAVQYAPITCLVWGAVQAVVECASKSSDMLHEVLDLISELNNELPQMEEYLALFPGKQELQWPIQDLYDDYMDYCIAIIQYLRRKPSINVVKYLWTSTPRQNLERTKDRIREHVKDFRKEATLLNRKSVRQQNRDIARTLAAPMTSVSDADSKNTTLEIQFPVNTVTMYRNYTFVGRDSTLEDIHNKLQAPRTSRQRQSSHNANTTQPGNHSDVNEFPGPACCVLLGLGGVGKTQTALEYTYRFRKHYDAIFWLPAERDADLAPAYAHIAERLNLVPQRADENEKNEKIAKARRWFEETSRKWLLVFDNMEDIFELNAYLPTNTKVAGSVLMTTQKPDCFPVTEVFHKIQLETFSRADASRLLFKYLEREPANDEEDETAMKISDVIGGLPLAIAAIGGYINQSESSVQEFLENVKRSSNAWQASAIGNAKQYEKTLETVFDIALNELPTNARQFINVLAFLNPDEIPEDIFTAHFKNPAFDFLRNKHELTENIRILRRRQLVQRHTQSGSGPYLSIHRTLQWNILLDLSKDYSHRWSVFRQTMTLLRRGMPITSPLDVPEPEKWPQFEKYVPQVLNLRTHCLWPEPPVELPVDFAEVLTDLATYMWHAGLSADGHEALNTAIDIFDDEKVDKSDSRRSDVYAKLGILISYNGVSDRKETLERRRQAYDIRHKEFEGTPPGNITRNDEIRLYNVKCDLAWTYLHESRFADAEPIMDQCLSKYKTWDSEENIPYEYAKYYTLMSFVRMSQDKPDTAVEFSRHGADLVEKAAGVNHPVTQLWRFALANVAFHAGALQQALDINQEVLEARRKICGEFNHFTLESYSTCAALLQRLGRSQEAEPLLNKCLERRKRSAWNAEGVARAQYRRSRVLRDLRKEENAEKEGKEATKTRKRFLKDYPDRLKDDPDEEVVLDQMVSLWAGRLTGIKRNEGPPLDQLAGSSSSNN